MGVTRPYTLRAKVFGPQRRTHLVDRALRDDVLDRLNRLPGVRVYSVCAGHHAAQAHVILSACDEPEPLWMARAGLSYLQPYLERLSSTEYRAWVQFYKGNGGPAAWHLEVRREDPGEAPAAWWRGLVDVLEENPNCDEWLSGKGRRR